MNISIFATTGEPEMTVIEFQPALIKLFHRRGSNEISPQESVKEHLWSLHFADYGRCLLNTNFLHLFIKLRFIGRISTIKTYIYISVRYAYVKKYKLFKSIYAEINP